MTGPEHYREAERLIAEARQQQWDQGPGCGSEEVIAEAQVHATLALAAATVAPYVEAGETTVDGPAADWQEATS